MRTAGATSTKVISGLGRIIFALSARIAAPSTAKPGLRNSRRLDCHPAQIDPAPCAQNLAAQEDRQHRADQREREDDRGRQLHRAQRQKRGEAENEERDDRKCRLPAGIAEIAGAEPATGRRRAGREGQDQANGEQGQRREQRDAIDRPPPGGETTAIGARQAHDASRTCSAVRAVTSARKASPRSSKSRN